VVQLTTVLLAILSVLVAVLIFERAYRLAKRHVSLQHRVNVLEDSYKEAMGYIGEQEKTIDLLKQELDFVRREEQTRTERPERTRAWNPGDPLNLGSRQ
jgi:hypothetical protein